MSIQRYTVRESADTTSSGTCAASASASAVLPTPVGPTSASTNGFPGGDPSGNVVCTLEVLGSPTAVRAAAKASSAAAAWLRALRPRTDIDCPKGSPLRKKL